MHSRTISKEGGKAMAIAYGLIVLPGASLASCCFGVKVRGSPGQALAAPAAFGTFLEALEPPTSLGSALVSRACSPARHGRPRNHGRVGIVWRRGGEREPQHPGR